MQIQINGKQMDVGEALSAHATDRLSATVAKYGVPAVDAAATFSRETHNFRADAQVHLQTGLVVKAHALAPDVYAAFESCMERIDKQLRRYKRRLKDHSAGRREPIEAVPAAYAILSGEEHHEDAEPATLDPVIVAEMTMDIKKISVGEAVMQMELAHAPFLMFRNERHGGVNIVYRRDDGNIGWVDPENLTASS